MRIVGRGHLEIRASHDKTLEITPDDGITGRATCIVAVGGRVVGDAPMAGPVRLTITVDGPSGHAAATVHAIANPGWDPAGTAVVRRGPLRLPGTFATGADAAAADLPRDLVAALADPDARVEVIVTPTPAATACLVLCAVDAAAPDLRVLRAEVAAADAVVAEDPAARRLVAEIAEMAEIAAVGGAADRAARTLVVATEDLPGARSPQLFTSARVDLDAVGLPPALAAAAALGPGAPLELVTDGAARAAVRSARADHRLVVRTRRGELPALLSAAEEVRPGAAVIAVQQFGPPVRVAAGELPQLAGADVVHLGIGALGTGAPVGTDVRDALRQLLDDGVPTRTVARTAATLTGLARRDAYEFVLSLRRPD